ncbi:hypothetical protein [Naumannella halotolerans]|uniref:Uncharacterized protein n=1 Tax=Naumannella halotolerans TaxID=993414 RepID=A0A4V3ENB9_9ACTN|nr:hypothetical protein [Naumannella halotolerans]TDT33158.1 hypothetical protein CLV29_0761 [Naumannella halotolerans]
MSEALTTVRSTLHRLREDGTARIELVTTFSAGPWPRRPGLDDPAAEQPQTPADTSTERSESGSAASAEQSGVGPEASASTGTEPEPPLDELSRLARTAVGLAGRSALDLGRRAGRIAFAPARSRWGRVSSRGVIDLAASRVGLGGSYAEVHEGRRRWGGRPGKPRGGDGRSWPIGIESPLWLIGALAGVQTADPAVDADGAARYAVSVDLAAASAAYAEGLPSPQVDRYEQLLALPFRLWTDDGGRLQRVRYVDTWAIYDLYLSDWGIDLSGYDWSVLPEGGGVPFVSRG